MKKGHLLGLLALGISTACYGETYPAPIDPSQSDSGGIGLLQTPTVRMAREGELSLNYRGNDQYRYYSASVQLFLWLEIALRYTDMRTRQCSSVRAFSGDQTYKDKAFNLRLRLQEESCWLPQVTVGARNIGDTRLFDAEYLVASKAWGPFDFTLGLDWEYLDTSGNVKNPFCSASDKYCYRDNSYRQAGSIDDSRVFHGPASLPGGVEYQTPQQPLRLRLEYEGNNYQQDFAGRLEQKNKFNVGAIYHVTDWADVNLSYERGNTFMFGITLRANFNDLRLSYDDNVRPKYQPQPQDAILQHSVVANQLTLLKHNTELADPQVQARGGTLYVTGERVRYRDSREGIIRANRIMMNDLPDGIKTIRITEDCLNMPRVATETDAASLKSHPAGESLGHETKLAQKRAEPMVPKSAEQGWYIDKSRFDFHIDPMLNQSVGGPENLYMYQPGMTGTADLWLTDHLLTADSLFTNLVDNYNKFNYTNPLRGSRLPRVRTHVREYMQNDVYVNNLQANCFQHLGNGFYGQVYEGYLKTIFGGVGAEVLYRPLDSDWVLGLDANYVKQRDWHSVKDMMKSTGYSVKTGHLTAYWTPSFAQDVLVKAGVGQYLAGDKDGTLEITERSDNDVAAGGYTAITNVLKEEYGEGDFTKGAYVSIPLDLFSSGLTHSRVAIDWTPLTYDGGQQLGHGFQLYDMTSDRSVNFRQVMGKVLIFALIGTFILNGLSSHQERNSPPVRDPVRKDKGILSSCPSISVADLVA